MSKINDEKKIIQKMIGIYCKKKHRRQELCEECLLILEYAKQRLDNCRYGENKGFCAHCPTQCYHIKRKLHLKKIMRFSGPYIILYDPLLFFKHMFYSYIKKRKSF